MCREMGQVHSQLLTGDNFINVFCFCRLEQDRALLSSPGWPGIDILLLQLLKT